MHAKGDDEPILLVEDEDCIRKLLGEILSRRRYTVFEGSNEERALPLAKMLGVVDLLITNLVMPAMGGWELVQELRETRLGRKLRILYSSGYPESINLELLKGGPAGVSFLAKLFTPDAQVAARKSGK